MNTVESHWKPSSNDRRRQPSVGIPQIQVQTARMMAKELHLDIEITQALLISDSDLAEQLSGKYFKNMLNMFGGSYRLAIMAYNAGDPSVRHHRKIFYLVHGKQVKILAGLPHFQKVLKVYRELQKIEAEPPKGE